MQRAIKVEMNVSLGDGKEISAATLATSLSYASQPVVGTITVDRRAGALVITRHFSSRRGLLLLGGVLLCAAIAAVGGVLWARFQNDARKIVVVAFCLALIASGVGGALPKPTALAP